MKYLSLVAVLLSELCFGPAFAAVTVTNTGELVAGDHSFDVSAKGAFVEDLDFFVTSPLLVSVTVSDSVPGMTSLIKNGEIAVFDCLSNCTAPALPTLSTTAIASADFINLSNTSQVASLPQGELFAGNYTLQLSGTSPGKVAITIAGTDYAVSAVPESSTWAMILLGFATLGFAAYHQKTRQQSRSLVIA